MIKERFLHFYYTLIFLETLYLLFFFKRVAFNALSNQLAILQSYKVANSHIK